MLLLAPFGRDAELLLHVLSLFNVSACRLQDHTMLIEAVESGNAGAVLLTQEAFSVSFLGVLSAALHRQPHWSDLPVLVLVPGGTESAVTGQVEKALSDLPNVTFLERPIRPATLASSARAALRSRARQYEVERVSNERDRTAASLLESEKLAAVGRLAASISHEINNPLESIINLIYIVKSDAALSDDSRVHLEMAEHELQRAAQITKQNLRFHRQSTRPVWITAEDLFMPVLAIYKSRLRNRNVHVRTEFRQEAGLTCYEGEIRQVLSNLVGNAIDAMPDGGELWIRARISKDREGTAGLSILVADSGHGMSEEVRHRVFEAFYSTKGIGGTGLGLWVSAEIMRKHRGQLRVRSSAGKTRRGTTFRMFLPDVSAGGMGADALRRPAMPSPGQEKQANDGYLQ